MPDVDEKNIVLFGKVVLEKENLSIHLSVGLSESSPRFYDIPITLSFDHIFIKLYLEGASFDKYSFKNTESSSENIKVNELLSNERAAENIQTEGVKVTLGSNPSVNLNQKYGLTEAMKKKKEQATERLIEDLAVRLNRACCNEPEWKISQFNDTPLVLDPNECIHVAKIDGGEVSDNVNLTGTVGTDRNGYSVNYSKDSLKLRERINPNFQLHLRLYIRLLCKMVECWKPLDTVLVRGA